MSMPWLYLMNNLMGSTRIIIDNQGFFLTAVHECQKCDALCY